MKKELLINYLKAPLFLSFIFTTPQVHSSLHVGDCNDEVYVSLGKMYPSVGYFSDKQNGRPFGTGTLFSLPHEELSGRVVITCSHIFYDEKHNKMDSKNLRFTLEGIGEFMGNYFNHPSYNREQNNIPSYDISLFLLDEKPNITFPLPSLNLNEPFISIPGGEFIQVGYGHTGNFWNNKLIIDSEKRASYSLANSSDNSGQEETHNISVQNGDQIFTYTMIYPATSYLKLSPYISGLSIEKDQSLFLKDKRNWGISRSGDSGGPVFDTTGKVIGIIHGGDGRGGSIFIGEENKEEEYYFTQTYYGKYKEALEEEIKIYQTKYGELFKEDPQSLEGVPYPNLPKVLLKEEINEYTKAIYGSKDIQWTTQSLAENNFLSNVNPSISCHTVISFLPFNKEWILSSLKDIK